MEEFVSGSELSAEIRSLVRELQNEHPVELSTEPELSPEAYRNFHKQMCLLTIGCSRVAFLDSKPIREAFSHCAYRTRHEFACTGFDSEILLASESSYIRELQLGLQEYLQRNTQYGPKMLCNNSIRRTISDIQRLRIENIRQHNIYRSDVLTRELDELLNQVTIVLRHSLEMLKEIEDALTVPVFAIRDLKQKLLHWNEIYIQKILHTQKTKHTHTKQHQEGLLREWYASKFL